jgi:hypothetical protein
MNFTWSLNLSGCVWPTGTDVCEWHRRKLPVLRLRGRQHDCNIASDREGTSYRAVKDDNHFFYPDSMRGEVRELSLKGCENCTSRVAFDPAKQMWGAIRVFDEFLKVVHALCEDALECGSESNYCSKDMETVREQVRRLDPNVPVVDLRTVDEQIGLSLKAERLAASLSAVFGALATALAVIGLYGVMAYTVRHTPARDRYPRGPRCVAERRLMDGHAPGCLSHWRGTYRWRAAGLCSRQSDSQSALRFAAARPIRLRLGRPRARCGGLCGWLHTLLASQPRRPHACSPSRVNGYEIPLVDRDE